MKISTKIIITMVAVIVSIVTIFLLPISFQKNDDAHEENISLEWKKYSSKSIGIEFEIPDYLHAFPLREVNFRESEDGPGFINIRTDFVGTKTIAEAVEEMQSKNDWESEKIIESKMLDGIEAIITASTNPDSDQQQKTAYLVRGNLLYTISSRWIDQERFWSSVRFVD